MQWGVRLYSLGFAALGLISACERGVANSEDGVETAQQAVQARSVACTLTLPRETDAGRYVLAANGSLRIGDRAIVSAPIANMGLGATEIGADARVGDVTSRWTVVLRDRARVGGDILTTRPLQASPFSQILGAVNANAILDPPATQTFNVQFPAGPDVDVLLEPDQTRTAAPGRYRHIRVKSRATLNLRSGTYYVETLEVLEPQARLVLNETDGPVIFWVNQPFAFRGSVVSNLTHPDWMVGVAQPGFMVIESSFRGTIVAPKSDIRLATGNLQHSGAFFGRNIEVDPGVVLAHRPSSEITACTHVVGGVRRRDLTPEETSGPYDPEGAQIPGVFKEGVDQCVNVLAVQTNDPLDANGFANHSVVDNPSCSTAIEFCTEDGVKLDPQPSLQEFLDAPPPGSVCEAVPAVDRCFCPVHPASLGAACDTSADCQSGFVCATICEGPNCLVPRRCGRYVEGCDGLPEEQNCEDIVVCPDPESVGVVTEDELRAELVPPSDTVPGATVDPTPPNVEHFTSLDALLNGDPCFFQPAQVPLPIVDDSQSQVTNKGKSNWGIFVQPKLTQTSTSSTLEPFGVVIPKFSAEAGLDVEARVFGFPLKVFSANALALADACNAEARLDVQVGPDLNAADSDDRTTSEAARNACRDAQIFLTRATTLLNWAQSQVLGVIRYLETQGPNQVLCNAMNNEFALQLDCVNDPTGSARVIVDVLRFQYAAIAGDTINRAFAYTSALLGTDVSAANHTFFDDSLEVMGAEADFPVGPFLVTVGGSIEARLAVRGSPSFTLSTPPGSVARIGASFTVTPEADVDATALIGVGFKVITVGVQGMVNLVGVNLPVTAEVFVESRPLLDPRSPAADGYPYPLLDQISGFELLRSKRYSWDTFFRMSGDVTFDRFLHGQLDAFLRIKLLFFKKTWRRKIVSWEGIDAGIDPIPIFDFESELPFSTTLPEYATAQRFPYLNPPSGAQINPAPPQPPPQPCDPSLPICPPPQSPVRVKNLAGLVESTQVLCDPSPPPT
jgi:hypothetical protein